MTSFAELAQVKVDTVERPKPIPAGHYQAVIVGPAKEHKAKSGNLALRFPFKLVGPGEDVDADALEAAGGLPTDKEFYLDFWMSPDARWRFTEFGKTLGGPTDVNLIELAEWIAGSVQPFLIQVKQEAAQDNPEQIYVRFDNPTAA
jgi:hypothetical protein